MVLTPDKDRGGRTDLPGEYIQTLLEERLAKDFEAARTREIDQSLKPLSGAVADQAINAVKHLEGKTEASPALGKAALGELQ